MENQIGLNSRPPEWNVLRKTAKWSLTILSDMRNIFKYFNIKINIISFTNIYMYILYMRILNQSPLIIKKIYYLFFLIILIKNRRQKMDHNKIVNNCLKYFNFFIGILMFVVLSLNIESIFSNLHKFQNLNILQKQCINCNQDSLSTLIIFNVEASLLASFLAVFSFLLAFRSENWFTNNYKWFIPVYILILKYKYFVFQNKKFLFIVMFFGDYYN